MDFSEKIALLESLGYIYVEPNDLWFNPERMKCFSLEYIDRSSTEALRQRMAINGNMSEIIFYFLNPPSPSIKQRLVEILKKKFPSFFAAEKS